MLNTRDLEERWLKYKIKSYIPYITILISSVIIIIIISIFINSEKKDEKVFIATSIVKEKEKEIINNKEVIENKVNTTPIQPKIKYIEEIIPIETPKKAPLTSNQIITSDDSTLKLSPSLDFMKKMQHSTLPYYQNEPQLQTDTYSNRPNSTQIVEEVQVLEIEEDTQASNIEETTKTISITRRDASDDLRNIIKRFKKNNNPALSLFVAKRYYELGKYHKAYNYALITNQIDRDIDASWIIFARSLVKLDQKDMAIKTLKEYIDSSDSSSAKILLEEIVSGKFK